MRLEHWFTFAIAIVIALCLGYGSGVWSSRTMLTQASVMLERTTVLLAKENDVCMGLRGQVRL